MLLKPELGMMHNTSTDWDGFESATNHGFFPVLYSYGIFQIQQAITTQCNAKTHVPNQSKKTEILLASLFIFL